MCSALAVRGPSGFVFTRGLIDECGINHRVDRSLRGQCRKAKVPFFFKQWGGVVKSRTGRELDGRTYDEMLPLSARPMPNLAMRRKLSEVYGF